jgi:hypothetical protein
MRRERRRGSQEVRQEGEPNDTIRRVNSGRADDSAELFRARANLDSFSRNRNIDVEQARRKVGAMIDDLGTPHSSSTLA